MEGFVVVFNVGLCQPLLVWVASELSWQPVLSPLKAFITQCNVDPSAECEFDEGLSALSLTQFCLQSPSWCFSGCSLHAWVAEKDGANPFFPISVLTTSLCSNYASVSPIPYCGTHKLPCSETVWYDLCLLLVAF